MCLFALYLYCEQAYSDNRNKFIILKKMKKKLESLQKGMFSHLEVEKMKRIKGGYTLNTVTVYSSGTNTIDGTASADGITGD